MKKRTKKILSLALCLILVLSIAACSKPVETTTAAPTEAAIYQAGTYTSTVKGHNGDMTVEVEFDNMSILSVTILEHLESAGISDLALERIPQEVVDGQTLSVDAVSGATISSVAVLTAIEDCVVQAGGDVDALKTGSDTGNGDTAATDVYTDIVVVGAGGAGLAAAAASYQNGVEVIVLEKLANIGGSTSYSGGGISATGTKFQVELGIEDTKESWMELWVERQAASNITGLYPNYDFVDRFMDEAVVTTEWLVDYIGHEYGSIAGFGMDPVERLHFPVPVTGAPGGSVLTGNIGDFLMGNGIEILTETKATELITDTNGDVIGVVAEGRDGIINIYAKKVIMATGGYARSEELLARFIPEAADTAELTTAAPGSTGDGMLMAEAIGATYYEEPWVIGVGIGSKVPAANAFAWDWSKMYVNEKGIRFTNEEIHYSILTNVLIEQETTWLVMDSAEANGTVISALEADLSSSEIAKGETFEELAEAMGVPVETFVQTMETFNQGVASGQDALGKNSMFLVSVETGPFYGVKFYPRTMGTFAGVKTNEHFQVLREDGSVINNLYATGEVANKVLYNQVYMSGSAVQFALTSGRLAAEHAANSLK
ncbi:MAG: FAD-binding protein [Dethiosulfatibacter sp.]|nr:FAD-binding protein [Dethiosulfatibacter sp.]